MNGKLNMPIEVELSYSNGNLCEEAQQELPIFYKRMKLIRQLCRDSQYMDRPIRELTRTFDLEIFRDEYKCILQYNTELYKKEHHEEVDGAFQKIVDEFVPSSFQRVLGFSGDNHYTTQSILNARELAYLSSLIVGNVFDYPPRFHHADLWTELGEAFRSFLGAMTKIHQHVLTSPDRNEDFICVISYHHTIETYDEKVIPFDNDIKYRICQLQDLYGLRMVTTTPMLFFRTTSAVAYIPLVIIRVDHQHYGRWNIHFLQGRDLDTTNVSVGRTLMS